MDGGHDIPEVKLPAVILIAATSTIPGPFNADLDLDVASVTLTSCFPRGILCIAVC